MTSKKGKNRKKAVAISKSMIPVKIRPVDIDVVMKILAKEVPTYNVPIVTDMARKEQNPFKILISTILSLRTKDQVTGPASQRLFARVNTPTPKEILELPVEEIERLIYPVGFYHRKAITILQICSELIRKYNGSVPSDLNSLLELKGVGRKTANLVLAKGFGIPAICVDTHVHRITNRIGLVQTANPTKTEMKLRKVLPTNYWIIINDYLVAFGQTICTPISPWCTKCPIKILCNKIGVTRHR